MEQEAAEHLRRLIGFRTVNPPGDELALARYLAATFSDAGIPNEIVETAPARAAVAARLSGNGGARAVMLLAHMDVVGVEGQRWSTDPFAAEVRDGYIYGRGAIDDKGMLAVNLVTMLTIKRALDRGEITLERDILFLATPDEETGGELGMEWLVSNRPDLFEVQYALNEGGRIRIADDGARTLLIQTAEKTSHVVTITARGPTGHAGVPLAENAILRLGRALSAISEYAADPAHGVSPTILCGGFKSNVIPPDVTATLNVRTIPGQSVDDIVAELARLIADPMVAVEVSERGDEAPATPAATQMYEAIAAAARALDPAITVREYLSAGVTDSARLRQLGISAYGVLPFPLTADDEARMHGVDERIPIQALGFGARLVHGAIVRIAGSEPLNSAHVAD